MAVITPDTFNPLRRYVGVRLQQGVPLVDADENEREDVRHFEVRAFLKWFVGNGVPEGSDNSFRIDGAGANDNFFIRAGVTPAPAGLNNIESALRHVGRCLVDGLDAMIETDTNFRAQPLHPSQPNAAALEAAWGVPRIVNIPNVNGTVVAYLDVWNRLIMPSEEPTLVHPQLGTESCARLKREWVVRVRQGTTAPVFGEAEYIAGHGYYALATITRRLGDPAVNSADVTDRRERRLLMPPATLIADTLGTSPTDYRMGIGRPAISLREAINALLRGEIPSTPDTPVAPSAGQDTIRRGFLFDRSNGVVAVWSSGRVTPEQVFITRINQNDIAAGFAPPQQVTSGLTAHADPHAAVMQNGELIVTYRGGSGPTADIFYKRATLDQLGAAPEQTVISAASAQLMPTVLIVGNTAVFIFLNQTGNTLQFRRLNLTTNLFTDATPLSFGPTPALQDYHAAVDPGGNIWLAVRVGAEIRALRLNPATGAVDQEQAFTLPGVPFSRPFVLPISNTDVRLYCNSPNELLQVRHNGTSWQSLQIIPNTINNDQEVAAVRDAQGSIWLFWSRFIPVAPANVNLFFMTSNPSTGAWGQPKQLTISAGNNTSPVPLMAPNNAIWVFWASDRTGDTDVFFKRLVTAL